ncbi:MAG: metal ABC transporter ATP-binding protein [Deltaproteobacteria bacterium]|jgi:zinc transport system ATP-binding protein|nr:metal ABC transporter ATP-binding protein [Deltaproteobacteria bacterium]
MRDISAAEAAPDSIQAPEPLQEPKPAVVMRELGVQADGRSILKGVSATIPTRRQTVIIGPNGAGKSTLARALLGEIAFTGSALFTPEKPVFGYVPQRLDFDRRLPLTVNEFMSLGRTRWPMWLRIPSRTRAQNRKYLEMVRADALLDRPLGSLSGGETQRIFLARALTLSPDILILDEPATGVDVYGEQLLCEVLETFKKDFTIIMVSHDLAMAKAHGDWIICLNRTVVAEGPPRDIFRPAILSLAFGLHQSLLFEDSLPATDGSSHDHCHGHGHGHDHCHGHDHGRESEPDGARARGGR